MAIDPDKLKRLNVIVTAHEVMEYMKPEDRVDFMYSFGFCSDCGEKLCQHGFPCQCLNDE